MTMQPQSPAGTEAKKPCRCRWFWIVLVLLIVLGAGGYLLVQYIQKKGQQEIAGPVCIQKCITEDHLDAAACKEICAENRAQGNSCVDKCVQEDGFSPEECKDICAETP